MKSRSLLLTIGAIMLLVVQIMPAAPVTGDIGMDGDAVLDAGSVVTATKVVSWDSVIVVTHSGTFTNVAILSPVTLSQYWSFNSGPVANFWSAGGFTFNLASSSVFSDSGGFLDVTFIGTVRGNGYDPTPCFGVFQVADPAEDGETTYTCRLSFNTLSPPKLATAASGTNSLKILWRDNSYNYTVQQNSDLTTTNWVTANCTITNSQGTNFATVTGVTNTMFFRLGL